MLIVYRTHSQQCYYALNGDVLVNFAHNNNNQPQVSLVDLIYFC